MQKQNRGDDWFRKVSFLFSASIPSLLLGLIIVLLIKSYPAMRAFGIQFIFKSSWDPLRDNYGALPFIYGTLVSSTIALLLAVPVGVLCALYLSDVSRSKFKEYVGAVIELLAAVPSIIFGLWGIFVLGPFLADVIQPFFIRYLGFIPVFSGPASGLSLFTAGVILAIMILPSITSICREVFQAVPASLRESAMALGSTRWETIRIAVLPPARLGIIGAVILGLGRAFGETMAVTMVIGNRPEIARSFFAPAYTLASVIVNEFAEAVSPLNLSVLVELGLILLCLTIIINGLARLLIWKTVGKNTIK